jgi:hypothetical protein
MAQQHAVEVRNVMCYSARGPVVAKRRGTRDENSIYRLCSLGYARRCGVST